jgi:F-type H+-transporting ATPase subunit gamma
MAVSTRIIKRRIKSVSSTRKITKAMELVSAAKMRKAVQAVLASRPYSRTAWAAVGELAAKADAALHPLLRREPLEGGAGRELVVFYASDRGLCGGYLSQVTRALGGFMAGRDRAGVDVVTIGRKAADAAARRGYRVIASFSDLAVQPSAAELRPVAKIAMDGFVAGAYDRVHLCFTDYRSALVQRPVVRTVLPLGRMEGLGEIAGAEPLAESPALAEYLFEPSPGEVLAAMLPRLIESQVYQALLEASASEHSARMMAMRSATDAATEMIDALTLAFNQARQAGITREIAEISSGKAALES